MTRNIESIDKSARKRSPYSDDTSKQDPTEDRFGVTHLATKVADFIFELSAPLGYVIGLHGQWGSRKSSDTGTSVDHF